MSARANLFLFLFCGLGLLQTASGAPVELNLDTVLDWDSEDFVSVPKLEKLMEPVKDFRVDTTGDSYNVASWKGFQLNEYELSLFKKEFLPIGILRVQRNSVLSQVSVRFDMKGKPAGFQDKVEARLEKATKTAPTYVEIVSNGTRRQVKRWQQKKWYATIDLRNDELVINVLMKLPSAPSSSQPTTGPGGGGSPSGVPGMVIPPASPPAPPAPPTAPDEEKKIEVAVVLDFLLNLELLWKCTPDDFEKIFRPKKEGPQEQPAPFEWLDAGRTQARFSSKMALNLEAKMTLFGDAVQVKEAIVEFVNGRAARVILSLYEQAEAGAELALVQFEKMYIQVGKSLGQMLKVVPQNISETVSSLSKTVSWQWLTPLGIVLLEYNDYKAEGLEGKPEFLRIRLASPEQMAWILGKAMTGGQ